MAKPPLKEYHCPQCKRLIYDRMNPVCGYCGAALPKEFRLSAEEIAAIQKEKAELEAERLKTKEQLDAERKKRNETFFTDPDNFRPPTP